MSESNELTDLFSGRHLSMKARGRWEFATRNTQRSAVGIVAITDAGNVVLVEQFRPAIGRKLVELPAGLSGDIAGAEHESLLIAAQRELLEETGYEAAKWIELGSGYTSPGLTDELIVLFLAQQLTKVAPGGGDETEAIEIHEVPVAGVLDWLRERNATIDFKLLAGLCAAGPHLAECGPPS